MLKKNSKIPHWFPNNKNLNIKKLIKKRIPITEWLPKYKLSLFLQDLLAGFTVSLTEIPQGIAYAGVAELPPEYGLYSCIMGGITYAIFGSCKDLNIGPTSIMSLMILPYVRKFGPGVAVMLSFLSGIIIFALGLLNLGFIIEFFSFPIVAGFTCAASVEIASIQLNNFFGIPVRADDFLEAWEKFIQKANEIRIWDTLLACISLLALIFLKEIRRFGNLNYQQDLSKTKNIIRIVIFLLSVARNAIIIVIGMALAYTLKDQSPFILTGEVKAGFPPIEAPKFSIIYNGTYHSFSEIASDLGPSLLFLPLIAILELVSVAKAFTHGKSLDATQEILALGITNFFSSFVQAMPTTGAFSRTAINNASGVKTQFSGIFTSLITLLAIAFLTPTFYYVPKATMAAVTICAMIYIFEYDAFLVLWRNKKLDLVPFLVTFVCCLTISLEYGILIGIATNLIFILYPSARPKIEIYNIEVTKNQPDIYMVKPLDNLFFPAAENFKDKVLQCKDNEIVVINGKYLRKIDITVAKSLVTLIEELSKKGCTVILWQFKSSIVRVCVGLDSGITKFFVNGDLKDVLQDAASKIV